MLRLSSVSRTYPGGVAALRDITLDIPPGLFGLLGPNGAGKSTLMRTIATLQPPDTGSITFGDIDVLRDRTALRGQLGYLPQEFGTYPQVSAERMLRHFAALKGIHGSRQRTLVEELLARVNLWDSRHRSVDTFSGGMKQRYGIAQALLGAPRLLIVDEPTAGLDPAERRRFQNLLAEVSAEVVVILSTHIVEDVAGLCPRVAIMGQGQLLQHGTADSLIAALAGRVWTAVVDRDEARQVATQRPLLASRWTHGRMEVRVLADTPPVGMTPAAPTLEDVYFATLHAHGLNPHLD